MPAAPPVVYTGQLPRPAYAGMYTAAVPFTGAAPRRRTALILVAQVLMVVKGVLWAIAGIGIGAVGIYLLLHGPDMHPAVAPEGFRTLVKGLAGVAVAFAIVSGAFCLAVGVADIVLGVALGRPSNVARWFTVVLTSVAGVIAILGIVGQAGNHGGTVGGAVFLAAWLAVNIVIFYALVIDERSRQAFA